tara:strand:- start:7032 stop:7514 length:483 start_codon:yes stop_codon:yes gene_type:complete
MKSIFNKTWNSSKQPRKQIKFRANAPNHIKRKFMTSTLDKPLRIKHKRRNIEVRKGDEVKIMRGKFKGKLGKISAVDIKNSRVQVEGAQRIKYGGEKLETWFNPSKIKIISLDDSDKKRLRIKVDKEKINDSSKNLPSKEVKKKAVEKKETKKTKMRDKK